MCAVTIRETETACVGHTCTLQQSLVESMQDLECEAIEKEGWDCQCFLQACRAALQSCPPEAHGVLMYSLQLLTGNMSLTALLMTTPNQPLQLGNPPQNTPSNYVRDTHTSNGDQMMMLFV